MHVCHVIHNTCVARPASAQGDVGAGAGGAVFSDDPAAMDCLPAALHTNTAVGGVEEGVEGTVQAWAAPFLSAPVVQALQVGMCGLSALQAAGAAPADMCAPGALRGLCAATRAAVEQLYQRCYQQCAPSPAMFALHNVRHYVSLFCTQPNRLLSRRGRDVVLLCLRDAELVHEP